MSVLIAVLGRELKLSLVSYPLGGSVEIGGVRFDAHTDNDFTGFYDWLRSPSGDIVGVRYTPSSDFDEVVRAIGDRPYLRTLSPSQGMEIYFSGQRQIDEARSDDQAFGDNLLLVATNGDWAITFETYSLSEKELESIRSAIRE